MARVRASLVAARAIPNRRPPRLHVRVARAADALGPLSRRANSGRPLGSDATVVASETELGRRLRAKKPGPKPKKTAN